MRKSSSPTSTKTKKIFLFYKTDTTKEDLFAFLKQKLQNDKKVFIPDGFLRKYIEEGFVYISDRQTKNIHQNVCNKDSVSIAIKIKELKKFSKSPSISYTMTNSDILFEDSDIIVVSKPFGLPTHSTLDPDTDHLVASLKRFLKERDGQNPYLGIHHRLDKDTSGVIMFTKNPDINRDIGALFSERNIDKFYLVVTPSKPQIPDTFKIENNLTRGKKDKRKMISVKDGGDHAITHFKIIRKINNYFVIEAKPETGRTHQIRVHLSEKGLPILGDPLYGPTVEQAVAPRLLLHAFKLEFIHPTTKEKMSIRSQVPEDFFKVIGKISLD